MTRPIERIPAVLKVIAEAWIKNPDLRLGQLLENAGVGFHTEDLTNLVSNMNVVYGTTPVLWGTRGISGEDPLKFVALEDMTTSHIKNIVNSQTHISKELRDTFISEVIRRTNGE